VLQHGPLGPPAVLGRWLRERGIQAVVHHAGESGPLPAPDGFAFVASLGSAKNPRDDADDPLVADELQLLSACVERDVPVLGLCFGGQALATVLGGSVVRMPEPELGWRRVETAAPDVVAEGPWLQWHYEAFTTPPGAEELAWSETGPQAFRHGVHLGVQFHPESTAAIVAGWARHDRSRLPGRLDDWLAHLEGEERHHGAAAARAALRLFDAFWAR
jgi:GMP synthase-like glutamine amidotransferase